MEEIIKKNTVDDLDRIIINTNDFTSHSGESYVRGIEVSKEREEMFIDFESERISKG